MYINLIYIFLLALNSTLSMAQHHKELEVNLSSEKNISGDGKFLIIHTDYPTTGLVARIPFGNNFGGAFISVANDTFLLNSDEHMESEVEYQYSNLITFDEVTDQFQFYPGNLSGTIIFSFIDARMPDETSAKKEVKKKRCRLFRARND